MTDSEHGKGGQSGVLSPADSCRGAQTEALFREYNYILNLPAADLAIFETYREDLRSQSSGFAEIFYDYLFDHPDIADVLYSHERDGGDTGVLARTCMQSLLAGISLADGKEAETQLHLAGCIFQLHGFRPSWIIGAYNLLRSYLLQITSTLEAPAGKRRQLEDILQRMLLRDLSVVLESYWRERERTAQQEMSHLSARLCEAENILSGVPSYFWSVDVGECRVSYANFQLRTLCGDSLQAPFPLLEQTFIDDRELLLSAWQDATGGCTRCPEVRMSLSEGDLRWYRLSMFPVHGPDGRINTVHCMLEDVSQQISERQQLQQLAMTDRLTGLPTRSMWSDHVNMALAAARRTPGTGIVVIALDINQFRMYNDTLGMDVGDILLRDVAERLRAVIRESDSLVRLGGDQFAILMHPVSSVKEATERVISKVLDSFDVPFVADGRQLCVSLTLGIACFPGDGNCEKSLLTNAESAMQRAKRNGLPYQYFDPLCDVSSIQQVHYSGQLRAALVNGEFELYYQPQVDLRTSGITGAEALLRWVHPAEGIIMPQRIIPLAEQLGMMMPITEWVLMTALVRCRHWQQQGVHIRVSVNVSAHSFQSPRFLEKIGSALESADVDGDMLEVEITEATLMQDTRRAVQVLNNLSDLGVTVAIDDFGTGYSSLSYLKKLPIHTLKIDQSFITDVAIDRQDVAIVTSIIELGHNLGYKVVAEGVENHSTWNLLAELGCDTAQGFHLGTPVPEPGFSHMLATRSPGFV